MLSYANSTTCPRSLSNAADTPRGVRGIREICGGFCGCLLKDMPKTPQSALHRPLSQEGQNCFPTRRRCSQP